MVHERCLNHWLTYKSLQSCELCGYTFRYRDVVDAKSPRWLGPHDLWMKWLETESWKFRLALWAVSLGFFLPLATTLFIYYTAPLDLLPRQLSSLPFSCFCGFLVLLLAAALVGVSCLLSCLTVEAEIFFNWWRTQSRHTSATPSAGDHSPVAVEGTNRFSPFEFVIATEQPLPSSPNDDAELAGGVANDASVSSSTGTAPPSVPPDAAAGQKHGAILINGSLEELPLLRLGPRARPAGSSSISDSLTHSKQSTHESHHTLFPPAAGQSQSSNPLERRLELNHDPDGRDLESAASVNCGFPTHEAAVSGSDDLASVSFVSTRRDSRGSLSGVDNSLRRSISFPSQPCACLREVEARRASYSDSHPRSMATRSLMGSRECLAYGARDAASSEDSAPPVAANWEEFVDDPAVAEVADAPPQPIHPGASPLALLEELPETSVAESMLNNMPDLGRTADGNDGRALDLFEFLGLKGSYRRLLYGSLLLLVTATSSSLVVLRMRWVVGQTYLKSFVEQRLEEELRQNPLASELIASHLIDAARSLGCRDKHSCSHWWGLPAESPLPKQEQRDEPRLIKAVKTEATLPMYIELAPCPPSGLISDFTHPAAAPLLKDTREYIPKLTEYNLDLFYLHEQRQAPTRALRVLLGRRNASSVDAVLDLSKRLSVRRAALSPSPLFGGRKCSPTDPPDRNGFYCGGRLYDIAVLGVGRVQMWIAGMRASDIPYSLVGYIDRTADGLLSYKAQIVSSQPRADFAVWFVGVKQFCWDVQRLLRIVFYVLAVPFSYSLLTGLHFLSRTAALRKVYVRARHMRTQLQSALAQSLAGRLALQCWRTGFQVMLFVCSFEEWAYLVFVVFLLHLVLPCLVGRVALYTMGLGSDLELTTIVQLIETNCYVALLASVCIGKVVIVSFSVVTLSLVASLPRWSNVVLDDYCWLGLVSCAYYSCQHLSFTQASEFSDDLPEDTSAPASARRENQDPPFSEMFPHACRAFFSVSTWDCVMCGMINLLICASLLAGSVPYVVCKKLVKRVDLTAYFSEPAETYGEIDVSLFAQVLRAARSLHNTVSRPAFGVKLPDVYTCLAAYVLLYSASRLLVSLRRVPVPCARIARPIEIAIQRWPGLVDLFFGDGGATALEKSDQHAAGVGADTGSRCGLLLRLYVWIRRRYRGLAIPDDWEIDEVAIRVWPRLKKIYLSVDDVAGVEYASGIRLVRRISSLDNKDEDYTVAGVFVAKFPNGPDVQFQVWLPKACIPNHEIGHVRFAASRIFTIFEGQPVPHTVRGFYLTESDGRFTFRYTIARTRKATTSAAVQPQRRRFFLAIGLTLSLLVLAISVDFALVLLVPFHLGKTFVSATSVVIGASSTLPSTWVWGLGVGLIRASRYMYRKFRSVRSFAAWVLSQALKVLIPIMYGYLFDKFFLCSTCNSVVRWYYLGLIPHYIRWAVISLIELHFHPLLIFNTFSSRYYPSFARMIQLYTYEQPIDDHSLLEGTAYVLWNAVDCISVVAPLRILEEGIGYFPAQLYIATILFFYGLYHFSIALKCFHDVAWKKKYVRARELLNFLENDVA